MTNPHDTQGRQPANFTDPPMGCEHPDHEDHMICANCGECREDLDENDLCSDCREGA